MLEGRVPSFPSGHRTKKTSNQLMHVCKYVMSASVYAYARVNEYARVYVRVYVCVFVSLYVYEYARVKIYMCTLMFTNACAGTCF